MAITHIGTETATGSGGATTSVTKPAGSTEDDVAIAYICVDGTETSEATLPTGFTQLAQVTFGPGPDGHGKYGYKVLGASEPSSYSFGANDSEDRAAGISVFRGVLTSDPIDTHANDNGNSSTPTAPSVTTTVPDAMLVALALCESGDASPFTPPTDMTEIADATSGGGPQSAAISAAYDEQASTGSSGTKAFTASDNDTWAAALIALKPSGFTSVTLNDSLDTADNVGRALTRLTLLNDSANISDTASSVFSIAMAAGVLVSDNADRAADIARAILEAVEVQDTATRAAHADRRAADALDVADDIDRQANIRRVFADGAIVADQATVHDALTRILSDNVTVLDSSEIELFARILFRFLYDAVDTDDNSGILRVIFRAFTESLDVADSKITVLRALVSLIDSLDVADEFEVKREAIRLLTDAIALADALSTYRRAVMQDSVTVEDTATQAADAFRGLSDALAIGEQGETLRVAVRRLSEVLAVEDDSVAELGLIVRILTDAIEYTEALASAFTMSMVDRLPVDDDVFRTGEFQRMLADAIIIEDATDRLLSVGRVLLDGITLPDDEATRYKILCRILPDNVRADDHTSQVRTIPGFIGQGIFTKVWREPIDTNPEKVFIVSGVEIAIESGIVGEPIITGVE